jgi:hypothetical protein
MREIHYWGSFARLSRVAGRTIREQWGALEHFLQACTDAPAQPPEASLKLFVQEAASDGEFFASAFARARALFGSPQEQPGGIYPQSVQYQWELVADAFPAAIDFLAGGEPWYVRSAPAVRLDFALFFHLRDLRTGQLLKNQNWPATAGDQSITHMFVFLGPESSIYPHFRFPFAEVDAAFLEYLETLRSKAPFKLTPMRFRRAEAAAEGHKFKYRRLSKQDLIAIRGT